RPARFSETAAKERWQDPSPRPPPRNGEGEKERGACLSPPSLAGKGAGGLGFGTVAQREERTEGVPMAFANQVAVITGASSGLGWALARVLAAQGCKVGLLARRREQLETLAQEIRQSGGTAALAPADVADRGQTLAGIEQLRAELGAVDLLIA